MLSDVSYSNMKGFHCKGQNSTNLADDFRKYDGHVTMLVISIVSLLLGIFGNIAVVVYNVCLNRDKTASSWFVTHLALADLSVCLTVYTTNMVWFFLRHVTAKRINSTAMYVSVFLSLTFLVAITIDRYLFIAKPLEYSLIVTKRRTTLVIRSVWVAALVQAPILYLFPSRKLLTFESLCIIQAILNSACIVVIVVLNYKIFKIVKEQRKMIELQPQPIQSEDSLEQQRKLENNVKSKPNTTWLTHLAKEFKVIKTFAIIVGVLTCCFLPYNVIYVSWSFARCSFPGGKKVLGITRHLVCINSIVNPFIYAMRHKKYCIIAC